MPTASSRFLFFSAPISALILLLGPSIAGAQLQATGLEDARGPKVVANDDFLWVPTSSTSETILFSLIQSNDTLIPGATVTIGRPPSHGSLSTDGNQFTYFPDDGFRSLRHDSFAYTLVAPGGSQSTATVHLLRRVPSEETARQGFEVSEPINYNPGPTYSEDIFVDTDAALVGNRGLRIQVQAGARTAGYLTFIPGSDTSDDGGTTLLGCGLLNIQEGRVVILTLGMPGEDPDEVVARVVLQRQVGASPRLFAEVRRADGLGYTTSAGLVVETEVVEIELEWFSTGLTLEVNGLAASNLDSANDLVEFSDLRLGVFSDLGIPGGLSLDFDEIRFFDHPDPAPALPLFITDGFESDSVFPWKQSVGLGISESTLAAITGARGLQVDLGPGDGYYLSPIPISDKRFGARFRFDPSALSLSSGDRVRLLDLGTGLAADLALPEQSVVLTQLPQGTVIQALSPPSNTNTPGIPVSGSSTHHAAIQYRTAASATLANGYFRLWLDGNVAGELLELDNTVDPVRWLRLGALDVEPLSSGSLSLDDFESWGQ